MTSGTSIWIRKKLCLELIHNFKGIQNKTKNRAEQILSTVFVYYPNSWFNLKPALIPALNAAFSQAKHKVSITSVSVLIIFILSISLRKEVSPRSAGFWNLNCASNLTCASITTSDNMLVSFAQLRIPSTARDFIYCISGLEMPISVFRNISLEVSVKIK